VWRKSRAIVREVIWEIRANAIFSSGTCPARLSKKIGTRRKWRG